MGNNCCISARSDDFLNEEDFRQNPSTTNNDFTNGVTPRNHEVNILSYNIFIRPPPIRTHDDDFKTERLLEFIKVLPKYDIVCLQELFLPLSCRRNFLIKSGKKAGLKYSCGSPKQKFFSMYWCDGGLITLSRFPILVSVFKPYPHGVGPDYFAQKGVLYSKIRIGDNILHLFQTHTQACYTLEPKYLAVLMDQLKHCRQFIDETLKKNGYKTDDLVIALGDFNVDGRRPIPFKADEMQAIYPPLREYPNLLKKGEFFEYDILESILTRDYQDDIEEPLLEQYEEHPVTFGDFIVTMNNQIRPKEEQLTYPGGLSSNRRLDYIFKITPKSLIVDQQDEDFNGKVNLRFKSKSAGVEKFFVKGQKFTQLSDHYGVRVTLESQKEEQEIIPTGSTVDESFSPEETGTQI